MGQVLESILYLSWTSVPQRVIATTWLWVEQFNIVKVQADSRQGIPASASGRRTSGGRNAEGPCSQQSVIPTPAGVSSSGSSPSWWETEDSKRQEDIILEYGLLREQAGLGGCPRGFWGQLEGIAGTRGRQEWGPATASRKELFFPNSPKARKTPIPSQRWLLRKVSPQRTAASVPARNWKRSAVILYKVGF